MDEFKKLRRGDGIFTRFGARNRQYGVVYCWTSAGALKVLKWRERSKSWTKPVKVSSEEFLYRAEIGGGDRQAPKSVLPIPSDRWAWK